MANAFRIVMITSRRGRKADSLARGLVEGRLAACVNVIQGVVSHYRWKGRLLRDMEALLIVKTSAAKIPALQRFLAKNHPYVLPEMLALKVADGSKPYLKWLAGELK